MANPAPIISSISAFDASAGTTIYYTVIGATEIIRSSKIVIYAVSDNTQQLEYLYTGTMQSGSQYQIVLPSSITSASLTNGTQYYATVQTFTDTSGTAGGSGVSVAKIFYCLSTPTLTYPSISSPVTTTTYDAIFTYTYPSGITNKIKQYELVLLEGTSIIETSGVIIGQGTQSTTARTYTVNYNFSSLSDGSQYTIRCTVLTTEGMVVTSTTPLFTCSIAAPSFNQAVVENNPCGGYITISSQITNIEGVFYSDTTGKAIPYVSGVGVDLTDDGDYVEWATGVTIASDGNSNNWTLHLWGKDFQTSESFAQGDALIYLSAIDSGEIVGQVAVFITNNASDTQIRAEMIVDWVGDESNVATYHTAYITKPSSSDNVYVRIRCVNNWFEVTLTNLGSS